MLHYFICDFCDITITDTNTEGIHYCPWCSGDMRWDLKPAIHGGYKHPIHSDSLAIHPSQRAEHERMFPNIEIDKQCRPVFNNFTDHEAYLEKCNLVKHRQKIKPKGKKLCKLPTPSV